MLYTVYSGSLSGPAARTTDDAALALDWAMTAGATAYVTSPTDTPSNRYRAADVIWTPQMERCCTSPLHRDVIRTATLAVRQ